MFAPFLIRTPGPPPFSAMKQRGSGRGSVSAAQVIQVNIPKLREDNSVLKLAR